MARIVRKRKPNPPALSPLAALMEKHLQALRVLNYSEYTVKNRRVHLGFFVAWCHDRGLTEPTEITRPILEHYQRYLFHYRQKSGHPLSFRSQHSRLVPLRVWFRWLARQHHILHNPASELELPRLEWSWLTRLSPSAADTSLRCAQPSTRRDADPGLCQIHRPTSATYRPSMTSPAPRSMTQPSERTY